VDVVTMWLVDGPRCRPVSNYISQKLHGLEEEASLAVEPKDGQAM